MADSEVAPTIRDRKPVSFCAKARQMLSHTFKQDIGSAGRIFCKVQVEGQGS